MFPSTTVKTQATNSKTSGQSRIRVVTPQGTKTLPVDFSLTGTAKHVAAIKELLGEGVTVEYVAVKSVRNKLTYTWKVFA